MTLRTRTASWWVSGLVVVTLTLAGLQLVVAQTRSGVSRPAGDASEVAFVSLGDHKSININNVAYTSDDDGMFDIFFGCSGSRGPDPLRLTDAKDILHARSYFNDEKRYGKHFEKYKNYCINLKHIAYIESMDGSVIINFSARISDAFVQVTLSGADAESFKKNRR